jgi:phosphatidylserine/phosphatidylglycerophosphate/cardiolipin synthase-like enzyme
MTRKKSSSRSSNQGSKKKSGAPNVIVAVVLVIIGFIIYAVTGTDLLNVVDNENTSQPTNVPGNQNTPNNVIPTSVPRADGEVSTIPVGIGYGFEGDFWQLYFTAPLNSRDRSQYVNGVDVAVAASIDATRRTLDIAAFELNNEVITQAILNAHNRGVVVRIVTDNEHGIEDDDTTLVELELAGIQIVNDNRSGLMHDKFMIMDGAILWMGSMNYTVNDVYRNNNNTMMLRSQRAVQVYQAEFNEMFERGEFGARSDQSNTASFNQDGVPIEVYFASENEVTDIVVREINAAQRSVRFMAFSFTLDSMGFALVDRAEAGVDVQGVFETTGSLTQFSEMGRLFCAGMGIRQDGNNGVLHHKVFVIDESTVIFGSFNFSDSAASSNDENLMVIREPNIASLFLEEFARVQSIATVPTAVICR